MGEHPKVNMGANHAAKQSRKLEREAMVTAGDEVVTGEDLVVEPEVTEEDFEVQDEQAVD